MSDTPILKIYPSASGFVSGQGVIAEYSSACPRYLVIAKGTRGPQIDSIYTELGLLHEDNHAVALGDDLAEREVPLKFEVTPGVWYSGRCDFITKSGEVHETKASISKNFKYSVINKGKYKVSHLAQLVSYLIHFKKTRGRIIAGFYKLSINSWGIKTFTLDSSRVFVVDIDPTGRILVDLVDSGYGVVDQYKHTLLAAEVLVSEEIKPRPINHVDFNGPCFFCPLKNSCSSYDKGDISSEELKRVGKETLNKQIAKVVDLAKYRSKK